VQFLHGVAYLNTNSESAKFPEDKVLLIYLLSITYKINDFGRRKSHTSHFRSLIADVGSKESLAMSGNGVAVPDSRLKSQYD
jgi:hypothetical protein